MRHLQKLMLLFLPLFLMPPAPLHATCGVAGVTEGGFFSAAGGSPTVAFQQTNNPACAFYINTLFLKVANYNSSTPTQFVVNAYDNQSGGVCTGNIRFTWTLVVGGTHGSSDVISLVFPSGASQGLIWPAGLGYFCIEIPGATGFVSTAGFTGTFY